jgi:asparagine synthase (glutamine-hydrolysing)
MGQKPLFYSKVNSDFLFASEVKAVLASDLVHPEPDLEALWHYIALRFVPDDRSLVRNVKKLRAGHFMLVRGDDIVERPYWSLNFAPKFTATESELTDELDSLLNETVSAHLLSDVEVGVFLSGGIDSSVVAAIAARHQDTAISSFSIGVKDQTFNELPYAQMAAEHCGLRAHEQVVEADLVRMMPSMIQAMDEPSDPFGVGVHLVSGLASKHVKVVLSGDGGDENFAGYDRYAGQRITDYYCLLPRAIRKHIMTPLVNRIPETFGYKSFAQKARWLNEMSFYSQGDRYVHSMSFLRFTEEARGELFTESARADIGEVHSSDKILEWFDSGNVNELVDRML